MPVTVAGDVVEALRFIHVSNQGNAFLTAGQRIYSDSMHAALIVKQIRCCIVALARRIHP